MSKTLDEIEAWLDVSSVQGAGSKLTLDNLDAVVRRERRAGAS
jgi:hypothetical protein